MSLLLDLVLGQRKISRQIRKLREDIMATLEEVQGKLSRVDEATTNLGGDVRGLKAKLDEIIAGEQGKIDAAVAAALQEVSDGLDPIVTNLEGLAAETPEEDPGPQPGE